MLPFFVGGGMQKIAVCILLYSLFFSTLKSVDLHLAGSACQNATNDLVLLSSNPSIVYYNPALVVNGIECTVSRLYNIEDLILYHVTIGKIIKASSLSIAAQTISDSLYTERQAILSYSCELDKVLRLGFGIRGLSTSVSRYNSNHSLILDGGVLMQKRPFLLSVSYQNLNHAKLDNDDLPSIMYMELAYKLNKRTCISAGIEKQKDFTASEKLGISAELHPFLSFMSGYQINPDQFSCGVVLHTMSFDVAYSVKKHYELNLTHYLSVIYKWKSVNKENKFND